MAKKDGLVRPGQENRGRHDMTVLSRHPPTFDSEEQRSERKLTPLFAPGQDKSKRMTISRLLRGQTTVREASTMIDKQF